MTAAVFLGYLTRYWRPIAAGIAVVLVVAALAIYRQSLINAGFEKALATVEKQDAAAAQSARKVRRSVDQCYDDGFVWNTITGQCVGG